MTNFERASLRMRADGFRPFSPDKYTARCGRVLRRPEPTQIEPDANTGDRIVAWVGAVGVVVLVGLLILEKVAA